MVSMEAALVSDVLMCTRIAEGREIDTLYLYGQYRSTHTPLRNHSYRTTFGMLVMYSVYCLLYGNSTYVLRAAVYRPGCST